MLYSLAAALLLKFQREHPQDQTFCLGHFMRVGYHLICKRWVYCWLSIEQAISGMWGKVKIHWQRGIPKKAPTGQNLQQLDEVPRSLEEGRSRKAKKVAKGGTMTSWENRFGRNQFGHKSSRSLETKPFPPGDLHQKFLGSLEGRRINKARISRTRNDIRRGLKLRNSDNHGFPKIIEIENE
jgi:hypothetical protein